MPRTSDLPFATMRTGDTFTLHRNDTQAERYRIATLCHYWGTKLRARFTWEVMSPHDGGGFQITHAGRQQKRRGRRVGVGLADPDVFL